MSLPDWLAPLLPTGAQDEPGTRDPRIHVFDPDRQCAPTCPAFAGVRLYRDALSPEEADALLAAIDAAPLIPSQSGKQKQHFGPRFDFMRRRMNAERFEGLPAWAHGLEDRLRALVAADRDSTHERTIRDPDDAARLADCHAALTGYQTTDVFVLRYREAEASNLDFHVDDLFAYGEVILDVSLDSDSVLTFLGPLDRVGPAEPAVPAAAASTTLPASPAETSGAGASWTCVRVPLPARSIAVLHGPARFSWQHALLASDVRGVRTSITLRTLGAEPRATTGGRRVLERAGRRGGAADDGTR